ncbi:MAG: ribosome recycling factor [Alphaproteobacteria bacterium]
MAHGDSEDVKRRMRSAVDVFKKELAGLRTGRASAALLEPITVEAYGTRMPLSQCGTVSVPEPRLLTVQVWDKGVVSAVEKAIREGGLGLNPQVDGQLVRVPVPQLNEERRKELIKVAHKYAEQGRVSVRNVRRDGMDHLKASEKKGEITQDDHKRKSEELQKVTDGFVKEIDQLLAKKEQEIVQV